MRAVYGASFEWDSPTYLLAAIFDAVNWANYQRGGGKGARPKPVARPGEKPPTDETRMGTPVPIEEARVILDNWSNN